MRWLTMLSGVSRLRELRPAAAALHRLAAPRIASVRSGRARARCGGTPLLLALLALGAGCAGHERLRQDDPGVTEAEVVEARGSDDPTLTPHLHRILLEREHYAPEVVVAALGALAERKDPASASVVARLEHDPDEEVRFHAALALRALGGSQATEVLGRMARDDASALVRAEAAAP